MAIALSLILVVAGFARVVVFDATPTDALAISIALFLIVVTSVVLGTVSASLLCATHAGRDGQSRCHRRSGCAIAVSAHSKN